MSSIYVLVHLPKCGGRSIFKFFKTLFGEDRVLNLYDNKAHIAGFYDGTVDLKTFKAICGGHVNGDSHASHLQGLTPRYVALVREPLERFVSYYNYLSVPDDSPQNSPTRFPASTPKLTELAQSCGSVEEFYHRQLTEGDPEWTTSNIQSMLLTGSKACNVDSVIERLQHHCHLVMPLPMIAQFCRLIALENDLPVPPPPHDNPSEQRASPADISPEFRSMFRRRAELDYFTYHYVCSTSYQTAARMLEQEVSKLELHILKLQQRKWLFNGWPRST